MGVQLAPPVYEPIIFYFPSNDNYMTISEILGRLEKSLSETLTHFYPLAGRYIEDKSMINSSDEGLEYWEAKLID